MSLTPTPTTAEGWAEFLRKGDGQALVPMEAAVTLYEAGMLMHTVPPVPHKHSPTHCFVRLRP